jgi:hypothetical protein
MFSSTQQKSGGLFGSTTEQQQGGSLFGASVFGAPAAGQKPQTGSSIFGQSQPTQQQQQQQPGGMFGLSTPQQPQTVPWEQALIKSSLWTPNSAMSPR